jgi:hypothetical protein
MTQNIHHSAEVDMYLLIGTERLEVDSCLENQLLLRSPRNLSACDAEFIIVVDNREYRKKVRFPFGLSKDKEMVEFEPLKEAA